MSRNLFNGLYEDMDNQFYYYIDQTLIDPIKTTPQSLNSIKKGLFVLTLIVGGTIAVYLWKMKTGYLNHLAMLIGKCCVKG